MKKSFLFFAAFGFLFADYFQLLYTPQTLLDGGKTIEILSAVIHPYTGKEGLDMGVQHSGKELLGVEEFYVVHKTIKEDLKKTLQPVKYNGEKKSVKGYKASVRVKQLGDHLFVLKPAPFYSSIEGVYLQPITKLVVNVGAKPSDWGDELGLDAEIVPLSKPYGIWAGSSFSAMVKASGIPVPYASIDAEFLNYDIDLASLKPSKPKTNQQNQAMQTIQFRADEDGKFTFFLPRAGWWAICAGGVGLKKSFKDKELSQDACIWVQVSNVK
ncbi:MAG: DUF4198 domain-containing protein [Helicobacteraceae bacterium]